jgi:hypothetical protein
MSKFLGNANGSDTEGHIGSDLIPSSPNVTEDLLDDASVRIDPLNTGRPLPVEVETILSSIIPNPIANQQDFPCIAELEEVDLLLLDGTTRTRLVDAQREANARAIRDMPSNQAEAAFLKNRKQTYSKRKPQKRYVVGSLKLVCFLGGRRNFFWGS